MNNKIVASTPKHIDENENNQLTIQATDVKNQVIDSDGGPSMSMYLNKIGHDSMRVANDARVLMQTKVSDLLNDMEGKSPVANELVNLRTTMDELNPHSLSNNTFFKIMPNFVQKFMLKNYIEKFQTNQQHVEAIFNGLRDGKDQLLEKAIELNEQYSSLKLADKSVQNDIYLGEMVWEQLENVDTKGDAQEIQKLDMAKNKIARRIRDLQVARQAISQFFVSINQTVQNNQLLSESIDSALFVGPMVLINALNIQAALAHQKKVANALDSFQTGLGNMMEQNAAAIEEQTSNVADLYNNPVIGLDSLEKSFDKLSSAINTANETMKTSTIKAREASAELNTLTEKFQPLIEASDDNMKSLNNE
jgi:uncharacterized protein YaaN involved in tellurite resistance